MRCRISLSAAASLSQQCCCCCRRDVGCCGSGLIRQSSGLIGADGSRSLLRLKRSLKRARPHQRPSKIVTRQRPAASSSAAADGAAAAADPPQLTKTERGRLHRVGRGSCCRSRSTDEAIQAQSQQFASFREHCQINMAHNSE